MLCMLALFLTGCKEPDPVVEPEVTPEVTISEGVVTENSMEFTLSAQNADEVAYLCIEAADATETVDAEYLFTAGEVFVATAEAVLHEISDLESGTEYVVYAAARLKKDEEYLFSEVKELKVTTSVVARMIEFVDASKTGFSYKVNVEDGQCFYHTYFEGWFFEYSYEYTKLVDGAEFDPKAFMWNMLSQYGEFVQSSDDTKVIEWYAGKENAGRNDFAYLVPGMKYYALAAVISADGMNWLSDPEIISFEMEEPGESAETIECKIDGLTPNSVNIRMECDQSKVSFYMYLFVEKDEHEAYVSENGAEALKDFVSEYALDYGQAKVNTYTDTWTVEPGVSYMLCVYGVDHQGDEFYTELEVNVPLPEPELNIWMEPYERDLEGLNSYNTIATTCSMANFIDLDYAESVYYMSEGLMEKSAFDAMLESEGITGSYEEIQARGEELYNAATECLGLTTISDEGFLNQLVTEGKYSFITTLLEPDTEYVYMMVVKYDDEFICRIATAKTDAAPVDLEESDAYKAYLGNWTVTGKETTDWSTYASYDLRIERLTSNRSFKVYGWSSQQAGQDFPFEATFNPDNGRITIATPQVLGEVEINDKKYEVHFVGKAHDMYSDDLIVLGDYKGNAYTGRIQENTYLILTPEDFTYAGMAQEFRSMSYVLYDKETGKYCASEPYDLVYFQITRAENQE